MESYIDEITKEQFIEDTTIREAINNIYVMLADMPKVTFRKRKNGIATKTIP